nr:hypothetical protein [Tanacetum cinerariifolium]
MACTLSHTDSEVEALVQKLIDEDKGRQNAIMDLALQFENSCKAKDDLRKVYEKCNDISQESRALIDTFLKEGSDKDYELNLSINPPTLEKPQMPLISSYPIVEEPAEEHDIVKEPAEGGLTENELHQLALDEEALRKVLEDEAQAEKERARAEKEREEEMKKEEAHNELFMLEFGEISDSKYETD